MILTGHQIVKTFPPHFIELESSSTPSQKTASGLSWATYNTVILYIFRPYQLSKESTAKKMSVFVKF